MKINASARQGTVSEATVSAPKIHTLKAVCVDAINLGKVDTKWGPKPKIKLVFETEELKENGYRKCTSRTYNISYYEKAFLRRDLDSWRGRAPSASEMINGVDFSKLIGNACELDLQDATSARGEPYRQIVTIRKAGTDPLAPSGGYKRWQGHGSAAGPASTPVPPVAVTVDTLDELEAQAETMLAEREVEAATNVITLPQTGRSSSTELEAEAA